MTTIKINANNSLMQETKSKKTILERYKILLEELFSQNSEELDIIIATVKFARIHRLTSDDMEPFIPKRLLSCCVPSVLDMIDADEEHPVE